MRQVSVSILARAGIARRSGRGLVLFLDEGTFYLTEEDLAHLESGRNAAIVNCQGEWEGNAWLSPLQSSKKSELTVLIHDRLFSIGIRHLNSLLNKERGSVVVREYQSQKRNGLSGCDTEFSSTGKTRDPFP